RHSALGTLANQTTIAAYLDTEIAAILEDTGELQTDWADGGRLDLLLDAIDLSSITVSPIAGTIAARFTSPLITLIQYEAISYGPWIITDTDGNAVDLSGLTLALVVYDLVDDADEVWRLTSGASEITVSGAGNNQVTLTDDDTHTQNDGRWRYTLWDTGNKRPLQRGILAIERSAGPTAPA
ncbi:hypothetical protein LCGC14_2579360, partial [marine sediment metagenome]